MKTIFYTPLILFALMATSCNNKPKETPLTAGIQKENMDSTATPGTNFYQYACGGWMKNNPLTDEYARFGSFDLLAENNRKQLKTLIEELAAKKNNKGTVAQQIGDLYNIAMDSTKLNSDGATPIQADLAEIAAIKENKEIYKLMAQMRRKGYDPYFTIYVAPDEKNSAQNQVQTYQSGIGLGERDYYLENDANTKEIRTKYEAHIASMFQLTGSSEAEAKVAAQHVMNIETALAKAAYDNVKLRDPHANYHKMSIEELKTLTPTFDWDQFLTTLGLNGLKELNVSQQESIIAAANIIDKTTLPIQKSYLQWIVINASANYLSDAFVNQNFDFFGKTLSGKKELSPRWKRSVATINGALGEAVGQMYVEKHFPAAAKERMLTLVSNLTQALGKRIQALDWMSDTTKIKAAEKLATFHVKIGFPDKWRDYSKLEINKDSYWANIERSNEFDHQYMLAKVGKPVDTDEWQMTPQMVNAYYNPTTNEICFPAGILQYPFFDMNADDAFNYGAIGVVIGHEMTHGFDDQGRQYDKVGNLNDWWTAGDASRFEKRTTTLVNFFDKIEVLPGLFANGKLTLGENIADHGGIQVAFAAYKEATEQQPLETKLGLTADQRFFVAYANLWAGNIREEQIRVYTKTDPHSLGKWRVNGALPHIDAWYQAFNVKEGDPLYLAPNQRVTIW